MNISIIGPKQVMNKKNGLLFFQFNSFLSSNDKLVSVLKIYWIFLDTQGVLKFEKTFSPLTSERILR